LMLIVGLGNPGKEYRDTRHNVGFMVIEALAALHRISLRKKKEIAFLGSGTIHGEAVFLAMPGTFMNRSGDAVLGLLNQTGVEPSHLAVVHDDLDLELGRIRIKTQGGHGGHKGVLSIVTVLQTGHFLRVRIGIGRPPVGLEAANYVLRRFRKEERPLLQGVIQQSVEALGCLIQEGPQKAMDRYNQRATSL
jgi:peptidyl-tRNA hydrolase, PTH1 family